MTIRANHDGRGRRRAGLAAGLALAALLAGCGAPEFDGRSAFRYLERQCEFGPRPPGSPAHEETLAWLAEELARFADDVAVQRFAAVMDTRSVELANVIASFRPGERRRVLFAAHWDTRSIADRDPDPQARATPIPGANDGASGVAVLLELARMMSERPPGIGVDLVLFDGEDGGDGGGLSDWCLGSAYYASRMGGYCPAYAVVIDMIGDADLSISREPNSVAASGAAVERVWEAARRVGATAFVDRPGAPVYDDHVPLIQAGVPAVLVIDFDYRYWHTLEDTPDKCSAVSLEQVGSVLTSLVYGSR
jgi:glutaminyl-peptide cyclotransferase